MKWTSRLKQFINDNSDFYKPTLLLGTIFGAIYLNGYLNEFDIPFPLDIGVLPTTLVVIGFLSIFLVVVVAVYLLLVGVISVDPFSANIQRLINTTEDGLYAPKRRNTIYYALISYVLPFTFFLVIAINYELESTLVNQIIFLLSYVGWSVTYASLVAFQAERKIKDRLKATAKFSFHVFMVQMVSLASLFVLLAIVIPRMSNVTDIEFVALIFGYILINTACILPSFSHKNFEKVHTADGKFDADQIIQKSQMYPTYIIVILILILSLLPPFAPYVGELPLRLLNIGGQEGFVAKDGIKQCSAWPDFIIDKKDEHSCTTKSGNLIIQLGDRAYTVFKDNTETSRVVSLNLSKASLISDIPEKSYYKR